MSNIEFLTKADGDVDAYYTNAHGARLHGYIWLLPEEAAVGVTGVGGTSLRFGKRAIADMAINDPAYRTKVVETAKIELTRQFEATDAM
jgi:hypothetical protein